MSTTSSPQCIMCNVCMCTYVHMCTYVEAVYVFMCVCLCGDRLKHPDVFDLIQRHNLWHALLNNLMNLLELDVEVCAYNNVLMQ